MQEPTTITIEDYWKLKRQPRVVSKRPSEDGYTFDSAAELARYKELKLLAQGGAISDLVVHPTYELQPAFKDAKGRKHKAICYEGDFSYLEHGVVVVEDTKGMRTEMFRLKQKLFLFRYPHIDFRVLDV